jgi:hypothetical protein
MKVALVQWSPLVRMVLPHPWHRLTQRFEKSQRRAWEETRILDLHHLFSDKSHRKILQSQSMSLRSRITRRYHLGSLK